ncbi:MAG: glycoside-pentoside-hexuronide (GPH):cation symporter [Bacillota bacterium]
MSGSEEQSVPAMTDRLSFGKKLGFGLGGSASNFIWMMISLYMLYFYTDVFGIPAAVAGTLFLVARIWDAVNDPIMGYIADQTRTKWGKFRPYLLFGSVPLAVIYVFTFTTPDLSQSGKIIYAAVTYVLLGILYTLVNIPYNSMAAVITQDTNERSKLASFMLVSTYITVLFISVATIPLVSLFPTEQTGFSFTVGIYAVLSLLLFLICFAGTREKEDLVKRQRYSFKNHIKLIPRNKYLLILISAVFFTSAANEMRTTAAIYYFKYNVGNESIYPMFMLVVALSMILGALLAPRLAARLGSKRNLYIIATLLPTITGLGILFTSFENLPVILLLSAIGSVRPDGSYAGF